MSFEVQGSIEQMLREVRALHPARLTLALNRQWAEDAAERLRDNVSGGPGSRYLQARSGKTRGRVRSTFNASGGSLSVSGPGTEIQEEGGTILPKNGKYLTFRLYAAGDGAVATGPWIRTRKVRIRAKHMVRDAAQDALKGLGDHLNATLGGNPN
ncbi:hypothetical protein DESA109040_05905 [Deinococcus saxicola]|uniref:hypothetical protein n=1 Tax=Deinococcus saxicola TaxID=249406 RepID=UPI0039EFDBE1